MSAPSDLVPLAERSAALQWTRLVLVAVVVLAVQVPELVGVPEHPVATIAVAYAVGTSGVELLRRATRRRALPVLSGLLLVDGALLAGVVADTGGSSSALLFLVHVHIVATALLASFRSGLVIAAWHGALLVAMGYADGIGGVPHHPTPVELFVIASFLMAGVGAVIVARVNERALRRSRGAASALVELGSALERARLTHEVALTAAGHLVGHRGYRRAAILVTGAGDWTGAVADDRGAIPAVVRGADASAAERDGLTPVRHLDPDAEPGLSRLLPDASHVVIAPLSTDGRRMGVLAVECGHARSAVSADELALLAASAERVSLALRTAGLLAEVERLASSDALTGLPNRRLLADTLEREIARARRGGSPLALAVVDVDHFKAVNDQHGHQVGDEVLRQLAAALVRVVRTEALVARYGGEEFAVVVPDATAADAMLVGERLRAAARQVSAVPVTISVGVATLPPGGDGAGLIAAADVALYCAKAAGRDCVVGHDTFSDPLPQLA